MPPGVERPNPAGGATVQNGGSNKDCKPEGVVLVAASVCIGCHDEDVAGHVHGGRAITSARTWMGSQADGGPSAVEWFGQLFAEHYARLYRFAVRRTDSWQDAEDLVAEVFMVAWRRLEDLPVGDEARLWLFGTARLILRNQWRGRRRQQHLLERLRRTATAERAVGRTAQLALPNTDVGEAMAQLSDRDRDVLRLAAWEGLTPQEIAMVLDVTAETARKRLQRARSRLRNALPPGDASATRPTLAVRKAEP